MYNNIIKRVFDFLLACIGLLITSPLFILIGISIKFTSPGEIFFVQERLGFKGQAFKIYKFRTMVNDAESIGTGIFTSHNDPRITQVGHLLRKTSLDELPQLFNVLKGDMSFVGPRPPVPYHPHRYKEYPESQKKRFLVKPGITGHAQVIGRNTLSWDERIELDIIYIDKMSFIQDIKILIKTLFVFANKEKIYNLANSKKLKHK